MDHFPLKPGLEEFTQAHYAYCYPEDPSLVIREFEVGGPTRWRETKEYIETAVRLFNELPTYDISVVPFRSVMTNRQGNYLFVADRVEGKSFNETDYLTMTPEEKHQALDLHGNQYMYLSDKVKTGQPILGDIYGFHQYVFGETGPVLVDIDPFINPEIEDNTARVNGELLGLELILGSVAILIQSGDARHVWEQKAHAFLNAITDKHLLQLSNRVRDKIIALCFQGSDGEEVEELVSEEIEKPKNLQYRQLQQAYKRAFIEKIQKG